MLSQQILSRLRIHCGNIGNIDGDVKLRLLNMFIIFNNFSPFDVGSILILKYWNSYFFVVYSVNET